MLLGFRLYLNYTSKIRDRASQFISTVRKPEKKSRLYFESWVDKFFTHNIKIVGLGMDFTEYTLWWLLAYRHFVKTSNPDIIVDNEITLVLPFFTVEENPSLKEMMETYDVNIDIIDQMDNIERNNYDLFYERLCNYNFK
jgi:hypothetical protein